jgi:hypothetical protein
LRRVKWKVPTGEQAALTGCQAVDRDVKKPLEVVGNRFMDFCDGFAQHFRLRPRDVLTQSEYYLEWLDASAQGESVLSGTTSIHCSVGPM